MNHERRIPAWLLRDLPALGRLFACFWLFVIPLIQEGFRVIRGGQPRPEKLDRIAHLLLNAEATLAFALWREAYRRLGCNHRLVTLQLADLPASHADLMTRITSYLDQIQNLSRVSAFYTEQLRTRWGAISPAAHGSTVARLRRAAHHEAIGVAAFSCVKSAIALMVSSARSARPSNHEGVLANARGPPKPDCHLMEPDRFASALARA